MGHGKPLSWFASPLIEQDSTTLTPSSPISSCFPGHADSYSITSEKSRFNSPECGLHHTRSTCSKASTSSTESSHSYHSYDMPEFHRHGEATTAELFYDLFFVANLSTFTSMLEINDTSSLKAYVGFFSLLWLTWYQVTLYDVRFSADSVFERVAKASHFGVMVGFAVIGPTWKPYEAMEDFRLYKVFGIMLMVSRLTLFFQYCSTLWFVYAAGYRKCILPIVMVMSSTLFAAIIYISMTEAFPSLKEGIQAGRIVVVKQQSNVYIAWYVVGILETLFTIGVSTIWRVISFKGTHMVQRMSLLTLIILGEGIMVICKAISKIVKSDAVFTGSIVAQIIAAILVIYWYVEFLYMSYFDRLHEEHFGSIKQQIWSILHFPLHIMLVLVLQGISILVIYRQAVETLTRLDSSLDFVRSHQHNYTTAQAYGNALNETVYNYVFQHLPKGVDVLKQIGMVDEAVKLIVENAGHNGTMAKDVHGASVNETAANAFAKAQNELMTATIETLFSGLSVTVPDEDGTGTGAGTGAAAVPFEDMMQKYHDVFVLVITYVF
ncbi:hypothetical protein K504DRAFT_376108, partial [Pleomassaria siparia CBS 279.74]